MYSVGSGANYDFDGQEKYYSVSHAIQRLISQFMEHIKCCI